MSTAFAHVLAGIAWTPQIRGILAVLVGVVVLMGSIYLLLMTNLASRLGFLIALAAFFGWMTIHGLTWWLYPPGNGPAGRIPAWELKEIVYGDVSQARTGEVHDLDSSNLPDPADLKEMTPEELEQLSEQESGDLNEWTLLPEGEASRGEAQTAVDAYLLEGNVAGLSTPDTYVYRYAFETGGKPERESDGVWDRVSNRITNTLRITNPPHFAVVQFQRAVPVEPVAGEAPPTPEPQPGSQVITAVLERDIGQRRVPAALLTVGSASMLGLLCAMLHKRDQRVAEHRAAPLPETTGSG